jgi:hypothetical protein
MADSKQRLSVFDKAELVRPESFQKVFEAPGQIVARVAVDGRGVEVDEKVLDPEFFSNVRW